MVATKRNILVYFLLNIITFGIYGLVVQSKMGNEINEICEGDNKDKMHYMLAWLLGWVTLGIYPLIWKKQQMDRMEDNGYRYGVNVKHDGTQYVLWYLLGGFFLAGIGMIVAEIFYISNLNQYADAYAPNPMPYVPAGLERNNLVRGWSFTDETKKGAIKWIKGESKGEEIIIEDGASLIIGRDKTQCNFVISESADTVSGKHVTVTYNAAENKYTVVDSSKNGTYIKNGTQLSYGIAYTLTSGEVVSLCKSGDNAFVLI